VENKVEAYRAYYFEFRNNLISNDSKMTMTLENSCDHRSAQVPLPYFQLGDLPAVGKVKLLYWMVIFWNPI